MLHSVANSDVRCCLLVWESFCMRCQLGFSYLQISNGLNNQYIAQAEENNKTVKVKIFYYSLTFCKHRYFVLKTKNGTKNYKNLSM